MNEIKRKYKDIFRKWNLDCIKLNLHFAELEFSATDDDQTAAWEMYIELITRVATQPIAIEEGVEDTALLSIYSLFDVTRSILKEKGRNAPAFTKIAIIVLNQVIRPFVTKWHKKKIEGAFSIKTECQSFRMDLQELQVKLRNYSNLLADLAMVEDLTILY